MSTPGALGLKWLDQDLTGSYVSHFELVLPDGPFEYGLEEFAPAAKRSSCHPRTVPLPSQSGDAVQVFNLLSLILFPKVLAGAPTEKKGIDGFRTCKVASSISINFDTFGLKSILTRISFLSAK